MTKQEKINIVENLHKELTASPCFYLANSDGLNVNLVNAFRKNCFEKQIRYKIVKNTLIKRVFDMLKEDDGVDTDKMKLYENFAEKTLKGFSGLLIMKEVSGSPAKLLKSFRKEKGVDIPILKGAYIDGDFYIGEEHLEALSSLKTKEELVGDVMNLLLSPVRKVMASLDRGNKILAGLVKALSEKLSGD